MKKFLTVLVSIGIIFGVSSCNGKQAKSPYDFSIVNDLGCSLSEVYVSSGLTEDWGSNLLGTTAFEAGKTLDISFSGADTESSLFDISVLTSAGTEYQFQSIDLNVSKVVTLTMQDGAAVASIQ